MTEWILSEPWLEKRVDIFQKVIIIYRKLKKKNKEVAQIKESHVQRRVRPST